MCWQLASSSSCSSELNVSILARLDGTIPVLVYPVDAHFRLMERKKPRSLAPWGEGVVCECPGARGQRCLGRVGQNKNNNIYSLIRDSKLSASGGAAITPTCMWPCLFSSRETGRGTGTAEVTRGILAARVENPINAQKKKKKKKNPNMGKKMF